MRTRRVFLFLAVFFGLIGIGLFYNQIIKYFYYAKLSRNNSIRVLSIPGPRGYIFDRNGVCVVSNRLSFDTAIIYNEIKDRSRLFHIMRNVIGLKGDEIARIMDRARVRPYTPVIIRHDVPKDKVLRLEEETMDLEGFRIEPKSKRHYPYNYYGSHIFGYLGEVTDRELESLKDYGYKIRDLIGRGGLEKYYETVLKGADGGTQIEVDSRGRQRRVLGLKEPGEGKDLRLTIDMEMQAASEKLLGDRKGVVILMDPRNGDIIAMASHPSFDPNIFVMPDTSRQRLALLNDRIGRPMSNKAVSSTYAPGSVFKIVTSSAGLETEKINRNTSFFCSGLYRLGRSEFRCWKDTGHASQNVVNALMNSCNVFFYNVGRLVGVDYLEAYTKLFGYGKKTGIDLPDEVSGVAPGRSWKISHKKGIWYEGETLHYSIGQSYLLVTPLQVLCMTAVVANGGYLAHPRLVSKVGDKDVPAQKLKKIAIKPATLKIISEGMYEVINNENGTGKRARADGVKAAGKTGTAQNPQGRTHAWFCGFAPYEEPKLCVVVFLEHGGKGGVGPASIAGGIFAEASKKGYL